MAVITLRQDHIQEAIVEGAYRDENGDWHEGASHFSEPVTCDAVPGGPAALIRLADGTIKRYHYAIHLDPDCPEFTLQSLVKLSRHNGETIQATVLGFHRYQHHAQLWI